MFLLVCGFGRSVTFFPACGIAMRDLWRVYLWKNVTWEPVKTIYTVNQGDIACLPDDDRVFTITITTAHHPKGNIFLVPKPTHKLYKEKISKPSISTQRQSSWPSISILTKRQGRRPSIIVPRIRLLRVPPRSPSRRRMFQPISSPHERTSLTKRPPWKLRYGILFSSHCASVFYGLYLQPSTDFGECWPIQ